jgi:hypothetical protein
MTQGRLWRKKAKEWIATPDYRLAMTEEEQKTQMLRKRSHDNWRATPKP